MALHTVAAGRAWLYSHNVGRGGAAGTGFASPVGIAIAKNGVVYVANRGSDIIRTQRVSKVTLDHEFITEFGRAGPEYGPVEPGQFVWLAAVALDEDENVYTADEWLNQVSVFDNQGSHLRTWGEAGEGERQLNGPSGLAMDPTGNVVVVNSRNSRIQKFTKDGKYLSGFGAKGEGEGEFDLPWGVTIDNDGSIFVADWNNHRVQKFSPDGAWLANFGHGGTGPGSLRHPADVAVDGDGDVYVVDWMNERVVIFDDEAKPLAYLKGDAIDLSQWGQMDLDANQDMEMRRKQVHDLEDQQRLFRMPVACAFDQDTNRLIVCDTQRNRLQVYEKDMNYQDPQANL